MKKRFQVSIRNKITLLFFTVAITMILLVGVVANYYIKSRFEAYTKDKMQTEASNYVEQISKTYDLESGIWNFQAIEGIGKNAMENGYLVHIRTLDGTSIWNARVYNKGFCSSMLMEMEQNMREEYPNFKGGYEELLYPLRSGNLEIGSMSVGYYGPYFLNDSDVKYIHALNELLIGEGILGIFLAFLVGISMSKSLGMPLTKMNEKTHEIMLGKYGAQISLKSDILEISQLTETINALSLTLDRQEELRKQLTSDIAHELRTPVATLKSHLELMQDGIWEPSSERLEVLSLETERLKALINDLAQIAELERSGLTMNMQAIDVYKMAEQVRIALEGDFLKKNVSLLLEGESCILIGDGNRLKQALLNVLTNGLKYTESGGKVKIEVKKAIDRAIITISDTGIGIPSEELPYIFERFYRVDKSRNRNSGGVGIGLAITRSIIQSHGGSIEAHSEFGNGSQFVIELPMASK